MAGKFELYVDKAGEFRFRLKAANGQNILASQGYNAKSSCVNGIESVKTNAPNDDMFERKVTEAGKFLFNLKSPNHQVIGTSQSYESEASMEKGIESVKNNAPDAEVVEITE
ncbi:DUF1508 domain-containing protein [Alteromonas aestuariivivens]|uniref:DUF1508 domain-containing protein n=1 Tax=Alteromonas aestuariivivens TaxID=1938339 RepID=A0A3D8M8R0_9ALTE|nr:YegP family protein [Alteromonas aestuariivivens]RDV26043.1 DUF1508 domain-containing protein [Alteromonas aestuariivivens]